MPDMQIVNSLEPIHAPGGSAVAMGFFDGVHLGHRQVISAAVRWGRQNGCTPAVFTFMLPARSHQKGERLLFSSQKHDRIQELGVAACMEPPFAEFCSLSPEQFVDRVLVDCFHARAVFCGDNFTFGARAAGNVALLQTLCAQRGIGVQVVPMVEYGGGPVSSSRIRAALSAGAITEVNAMLGRPYAIDWPVTHGNGIGTSRLGTPTINQNYPAGVLVPQSGVYLTRIWFDGWWPAATGIGPRPTIEENGAVTCETYVPGFSGNVYGQHPLLEFHAYYCPTRKFENIQQLHDLILQAGRASCAYFAGKKP